MARKLRIQYPGAIYHVMNRGDRREAIFADDQDRQRFLETLTETCQKTGWQVHAFCLMRNHFHLVVEGLKRLRWSEADLRARRKGAPGKLKLAQELRAKTTMPLAWVADRLRMGSRGYLAWLLGQNRKTKPSPSRDQPMSEI